MVMLKTTSFITIVGCLKALNRALPAEFLEGDVHYLLKQIAE